jgi:hypothetical protein
MVLRILTKPNPKQDLIPLSGLDGNSVEKIELHYGKPRGKVARDSTEFLNQSY